MRRNFEALAFGFSGLAVALLALALLAVPGQETFGFDGPGSEEDEPSIAVCGPGNPDCAALNTKMDCQPTGVNIRCNNDIDCACRWRPVTSPNFKCFCQALR